jgi:prolyl oligopeptidase
MIEYPKARRIESEDVIHGISVSDPYRWLEEIDSDETRAWIEAQNELTFGLLDTIPERKIIRDRIRRLWNYEKYDPPFKRGGRYFFTRNDGLQNQSVLYWMESLDSEAKPLLDPNKLSTDGTVALTGYAISDDGKLLAYGLSSSGSDWQEWRVRDVDTVEDLDDHLEWVKFSRASWSKDSKGFFYSRYDKPEEGLAYKGPNYYHKLYYHRIGDPQSSDQLVYERCDHKEWGFEGVVTDDGKFLVISVWKGTHRENAVFFKDLEVDGEVVPLLDKFDANYTFVGNEDSVFYFMSDLDSAMGGVIAIDTTRPEKDNWKTAIPESEDALQEVSIVGGRFIATYLHDAHSLVKVFEKSGEPVREVELPGIGSTLGFVGRQNDTETFFLFTGFTAPGTVFHYDIETGKRTVFRQPGVEFDPSDYETSLHFCTSKDGTKVPVFVSHKKGLKLDSQNPAYLYGYGGFNISMSPAFSISALVWMEMGGVFAQAVLRGGGEYGKLWHEAGMKLNKQNVFDDFIAAAEWLIEDGYTRKEKLAIGGGSNGGLLVGACMTQRPDLFGACLIAVGVLDMLRFHKFTIGWAWTSDYGSPDIPDEFDSLYSYSPYHNLKDGTAYPSTLITTGDHDDRVFPAHSFKFAAALQRAQADSRPVVIRIERKAGHGLGKPTEKLVEEAADRWAFLIRALDVKLS